MNKHILCVGAGYVGGPTMAMIAKKCPDLRVTVVDVNAERIAAWNSDALPIFEPGLEEIVERNIKAKRLFFTTDYETGLKNAEFAFIAVGIE